MKAAGEHILAADSLAVGADGTGTICKVKQARGCFFAVTGPGVAYRLGVEACAAGGDIDAIADRFLALARQPYIDVPADWFRPPFAKIADDLLALEMAHKSESGPPVAVLRIDPKGRPEWVKRGLCPAIDPTLWP